ncbi:MAG TPA: hypothetical protein VF322_04635 [Gammaproteobacteria bacterium]
MKLVWMSPVACALAAPVAGAAEDGAAPIAEPSVAAVLEALRHDAGAQFVVQHGWTVVASREGDDAVQWFFTPEGHPAHPSVVKRTALERDGVGVIELTALCHAEQADCDQLIDDFRQVSEAARPTPLSEQVLLEVGIALNDHDRLRVSRMLAEQGKAAEIRMDELLKVVIVPTLDETGAVTFWAALYEFRGGDYRLVSEPQLASADQGTAAIRLSSDSGNDFDFYITRLVAAR